MNSLIDVLEGDIEQVEDSIEETKACLERYRRSIQHLEVTLERHKIDKERLVQIQEEMRDWKSNEVYLGMLHDENSIVFVTSPDVVTVGDFTKYRDMKVVDAIKFTNSGKTKYLYKNRFVDVVHPRRFNRKYKRGTTHQLDLWVREWVKMEGKDFKSGGFHATHCPTKVLRIVENRFSDDSYYFTKWVKRLCEVKCNKSGKIMVRIVFTRQDAVLIDQ